MKTDEPVIHLCVGQSRSNKRIFFSLIAAMCCFAFASYVLPFWWLETFTTVLFIGTIWQGLRTYVTRTVFSAERVEHRNALGTWCGVEYSKIMLQEDRGESITIVGEDLMGKSVTFSLLKQDGNLDEAVAFLRKHVQGDHSVAQ